jgi:hypothetical protein
MRRAKSLVITIVGALAAISGGCLERDLQPLNPCLVSGVARQIEASSVDKVDLLFVVDNSDSMKEEQDSLKKEFPTLIKTLTSGQRADGTTFPAVKSLHLGVVSTDMGVVGIPGINGCEPNGGDDGILQHAGGSPGCKASYPSFLTFELGTSTSDEVAKDFECIATLGTGGCGYEQPLEAGLKALWPKNYVDGDGNAYAKNPISFLATSTDRTFGHGDVSMTQGGNAGFLRNDTVAGQSLIAVVLVTDEEDCSSISTAHFTTDRTKPESQEPPNLRCFNHKENLFKVQRYIDGFKALRPAKDNLVVFAAIAGVPTDLVDAAQRARFNNLEDADSRESYYEAILNDPRMQETPNGNTNPNLAKLNPSCSGETAAGNPAPAYPPVRIVEVARAFGPNGVVQSICQKDFGPAMDAIITAITNNLAVCLPKPLVRTSKGTVPCNVIWELPPADQAAVGAPTDCEGPGTYLEPVEANRPAKNERGGKNCKVQQLPVAAVRSVPEGRGWYYDDFAADLQRSCKGQPQRVSFTETAKPTNGVIVKLECLNETQTLRSTDTRRMPSQPNIGSPCRGLVDASGEAISAESACLVNLTDGSLDRSLFCHTELNVCVQACQNTSECPPAWVCDSRPESVSQSGGAGFCVNPTCGSE